MALLDSNQIKVFPSVGRDPNLSDDLDAELTNEKNMTQILKSIYKRENFVITDTYNKDNPEDFVFVLYGYYFKITGASFKAVVNELNSANKLYANIVISPDDQQRLINSDATGETEIFKLDIKNKDTNTFNGLVITENNPYNYSNTERGYQVKSFIILKKENGEWKIPPEAHLHWKTSEILNDIDNTNIKHKLDTANLNVTENLNSTGKATLSEAKITTLTATDLTISGTLKSTSTTSLSTAKITTLTATTASINNLTIKKLDENSTPATLIVEGASTLSDTTASSLTVSGDSNLNKLTVSGTSKLGSTGSNSKTTINGPLEVTGSSTLKGATTIENNLTVSDSNTTTLGGTLKVKSDTTLDDTLTVSKATTLNGGLTVNINPTTSTGLKVTGNSTLNGTLTVTGDTTIVNSNLNVSKINPQNGNTITFGSTSNIIKIDTSTAPSLTVKKGNDSTTTITDNQITTSSISAATISGVETLNAKTITATISINTPKITISGKDAGALVVGDINSPNENELVQVYGKVKATGGFEGFLKGNISGNAANAGTAQQFSGNRTMNLNGDITGSGTSSTGEYSIKTKIENNVISTANIKDSQVTTSKLVDKNVTTEKIADNAVTTAKIISAAVTESKIAGSAVTADKIANNCITDSKIATTANIDGSKLKQNSIDTARLNFTVSLSPSVSGKTLDLNVIFKNRQ